jgi:hypothetical protein
MAAKKRPSVAVLDERRPNGGKEAAQKIGGTAVKNGGESAAIVRQKGGTAVKNGGESAAYSLRPPFCFSFSFLLILDEGGFRGGRVKSAYSLLATTLVRGIKTGKSAAKGRHGRAKTTGNSRRIF